MLNRYLHTVALLLLAQIATAQQFIGYTANGYTAIQQVPYNPAWVNNAKTGPEINVYGINVLAGNNTYTINKTLLFSGNIDSTATEGKDFFKIKKDQKKRGWVNADILGPAVSFSYKQKYQFGIYTRFRVIANGGNITDPQFQILSDTANPQYYHHTIDFQKTGAFAHAFGEVGFSFGQMLRDDETYKIRAGVTLKYLMGFAAVSVYTKSLTYHRINKDSLEYATGDLTAMYTYNTNPSSAGSDLSQRAGKGSFGLDIGAQFEYHDDGDPNVKSPYKYSLAASITDIGSVAYVGDRGSASYDVHANQSLFTDYGIRDVDNKEFGNYLQRFVNDTATNVTQKLDKFHIGLPTAFRLNADYYFGGGLYTSVNMLLNLRGYNGKVFNTGYVSYINFTPRYDQHSVKLSVPITLMRFRTLTMGTIVNLGPFYVGSSTLLSSVLLGTNISNVDFFTGLTLKIGHKDRIRLHEYDSGYDRPWLNLRKLIPRFLRGHSRYSLCPTI